MGPEPAAPSGPEAQGAVIVFDGVCNLCNAAVRFVARHDPEARFRFAAAQSPAGQRLQARHGVDAIEAGTFVLIRRGRVLLRSDAALAVARDLDRPARWLAWLGVVPRSLRDAVYGHVARRRYRWFGRRAACAVPGPRDARRFLHAASDVPPA